MDLRYPAGLFRIKDELLPLNLLMVGLVIVIYFFPDNVATRIILALPCLLFFPGYALAAALFPRRGMGALKRAALSLGLSVAVAPLAGLALHYAAGGIRLEPVLFSLAAFIIILSGVAYLRRRRLPPEERFQFNWRVRWPAWGGPRWERALTVVLAVAVVGALGAFIYTVTNPRMGETFTEFYILGSEGQFADYPRRLAVGEPGQVTAVVINREQMAVDYRIEVTLPDQPPGTVAVFTLNHDEKWQGPVRFIPVAAGTSQRVDLRLYRGEEAAIYRELYLWVDVVSP